MNKLNYNISFLTKKNFAFTLVLAFFISIAIGNAQDFNISGTVWDEDSIPLPGVTVLISGTTKGVITNPEGFYSIAVSISAEKLEFRSLGMETKIVDILGKEQISVQLQKELYQMDEVVVAALGITREKKTVGYSVTSVGDEELKKAVGRSPMNALQGKIAGVNISNASGAPGASTRVIVRGVTSLSGGNQPLYVIDGIPVTNNSSGSSSINAGTDFGNAMNDINPDDIESINFLKGASATALYGSRAANGVIEIRTKKGENVDETKVSFSTSVGFEKPLRLIEYQNFYGQGIYGNSVLYENMSWGPAFDNKPHAWGHEVDGAIRVKPYSALRDNVEEFFETGMNTTNSISVSGGDDLTTYYFSFSNTSWDGVFPTKADKYQKNALSMRGSRKINSWSTLTTSVNYINKKSSYVPTGQGDQSVYNQIMQTPRDISLLEIKSIDSTWNTVDNHYSLYTLNPYYILNHNGNVNTNNRIFGSVNLIINPLEGLNLDLRYGGDITFEGRKQWQDIVAPEGNNEYSAISVPGSESLSSSSRSQLNGDAILSYQNSISSLDYTLRVGTSFNERKASGIATSGEGYVLEGFYNISNLSNRTTSSEASSIARMQGVFGNIDLSFRKWLNVSVSGRQEYSSTLPAENRSYFFPGISGSFVFSDLFPNSIKKYITFGKLRGSWAIVGNDAYAYAFEGFYVQSVQSDGYGYFNLPGGYEIGDMKSNYALRPEMTEEIEGGFDFRFFNNRIGLDITYYDKTTTDLIWAVIKAGSSGYTYQTLNMGELNNKGYEAMLNFSLVDKKNVGWDFSLNFTQNKNNLVSLNENIDKAVLTGIGSAGSQQINFLAVPGHPVGVFEARTAKYTDDGKLVVDNNGLPVAADDLAYYGNRQYKFMGGGSTELRIKSVSFGFSVDYRIGGLMYSRTKDISMWAGTAKQTLYNNRQPFIIPNAVVEVGTDENGAPIYIENTTPVDANTLGEYWANGGVEFDGASLIDKSFVKLREASFTFTFPERWTEKFHVNDIAFSVIGNNLLLWTPSEQNFIDPESTTFGNDLTADFGEYGAQPSVRSITFNLRINF